MADTVPNKTMVNSPSNSAEKGRTVEVARDMSNGNLEGMLGADAYDEFPTSTTMAFDTFSNRAEAVAKALGNKDQDRG